MTKTEPKLRPPLKWHGGKAYLARRINALLPCRTVYCEPFLGAGSVLLNRPVSRYEHACDVNAGLINFWTCLQDPLGAVVILAKELPYDEATFETAKRWLASDSAGCRAVGFLVRNRFSRGGLGDNFAWSDRLRGGQPGDVNAWQTILTELPRIAVRVARVNFHAKDGIELMRALERDRDVLFYCDPPYLHATRTVRDAYTHEMTDADHVRFLDQACRCRGAVAISGYSHPLYEEVLRGWRRHEFAMPNHSGQGKIKQRRVEVLWVKES